VCGCGVCIVCVCVCVWTFFEFGVWDAFCVLVRKQEGVAVQGPAPAAHRSGP